MWQHQEVQNNVYIRKLGFFWYSQGLLFLSAALAGRWEPSALHKQAILNAYIAFKWVLVGGSFHSLHFCFWLLSFGNIQPQESVKTLLCRVTVFPKKKEMHMKNCWHRRKSKALSIKSTVSKGLFTGNGYSCKMQTLLLRIPAKLSIVLLWNSLMWPKNPWIVSVAVNYAVSSGSFPRSTFRWPCPRSMQSRSGCLGVSVTVPSCCIIGTACHVWNLPLIGIILMVV